MIKRTIIWTRPNASTLWPWEGLAEQDAYEIWITQANYVADRYINETETTCELVLIFNTQEDCDNHKNNSHTTALVSAQVPILADRNITRQESEEIV